MSIRFVLPRLLFLATIICVACDPVPALGQPRIRVAPGLINDLNNNDLFAKTELSPTVYVDEVGGDIRGRIERVSQFLSNQQWNEAIEMLIRLTDQDDGKLTPIKNGEVATDTYLQFSPVASLIQRQLAKLARRSPESLTKYRERVDPLAQQWFDEASVNRDEARLEQIVRESFHSSVGDDALLLLGDLALEAGEYARARSYWTRIHGCLQWAESKKRMPFGVRLVRGEVVSTLAKDLQVNVGTPTSYVESEIPLEDIWARLTLTSILAGAPDRARAELAVMRRVWPEAVGTIGGKSSNYVRTLSRLLNESRLWPSQPDDNQWPTFAGNLSRSHEAAADIDIPTEPNWRVVLQSRSGDLRTKVRIRSFPSETAGELDGQPSSHFPIVSNGLVLIHDKQRIRALDINTGSPAWSSQDDGVFFENVPNNSRELRFAEFGRQYQPAKVGEQRFTISSNKDTLVATIGSNQGIGATGNAALVGFDLSADGSILFGPIELESSKLTFHGAPVIEGNRCWVGIRRRDVSAQDFVACFNVRNGEELWRTRICSADTIGGSASMEVSGYLLTKHEDTIYCNSHLGAVAALTATDGRIQWLTKYPRTAPKRSNLLDEPWHALRDLTPCIYHDELVIVAPSDTRRVFALHSASGKLIWETEVPSDATQILGVGENDHLILSGRRLWWLDVYTGNLSKHVNVNPFPANIAAEPHGAGRGVLSSGKIYWPVRADEASQIYVLSQSDGKAARQPIDLNDVAAGNLLVAANHLLVANASELVAFEIDADAEEESSPSTE